MTGQADEVGAAKAVVISADAGAGKTALLAALYAAACDCAGKC